MDDTTRTTETTPVPAPTEFGLARLLKDIRTAGAEPTHRFPNIDELYQQLSTDPTEVVAAAPEGIVIQFPLERRS